MTDRFSRRKRSRIMSSIKGRNTSPEKAVKRRLRMLGIGYRSNVADLPGSPDIVLTGIRKAIFVHGCFWHGHKGCRGATMPATNRVFWNKKITGNIVRDRNNIRRLKKTGWDVMVVWQCGLKDERKMTNRIIRFVEKG